ncbi:MAG: hypothetical protein PHX61_03190 [Alphaproteobacteria bacterium]|nr:hypothetical protein [Alphaproteobacteria bacterium]
MGGITDKFSKAAESNMGTTEVNAHLIKHLSGVKSPEGFTNRPEFERRYLEMARENLAETYLLRRVQNKEQFGTQEAVRHIDRLPNDYNEIKYKTGEMENIVNPTGSTGSTRMSGPTKDKLRNLEANTASLKEAVREEVSFEGKDGVKDLVGAANKMGIRGQDMVNFYELSVGQQLPDNIAKPILTTQRSLDDQKPEAVKAAGPAASAPTGYTP